MKATILKFTVVLLIMIGNLFACGKNDDKVCNVTDPLQNIEWLKKYCESLNETQDFTSVYIYLYKVVDAEEHLFKIAVNYSEFDDSPFTYSEFWRNCTGELIFGMNSGTSIDPGLLETFLGDKEYVAELFHLVKQ
jgi:hypothetical protein